MNTGQFHAGDFAAAELEGTGPQAGERRGGGVTPSRPKQPIYEDKSLRIRT